MEFFSGIGLWLSMQRTLDLCHEKIYVSNSVYQNRRNCIGLLEEKKEIENYFFSVSVPKVSICTLTGNSRFL